MVAIYARQSVERPDSVSIEAQIQQCAQMVREEYEVYADAGYSGKNTNRPEFERMMRDLRSRKLTAVVSYRLDRISRNIIDFAGLLSTFEQYGVKYISATEQFDTSTPMGRAMIYIVMVFAQLERETIATRIADNYRFRAVRGLFMGGNTPFGYDSRRLVLEGKAVSVLEPNAQSTVLQAIFDRFASMESLSGISHDLNARGCKTAKGNPWSATAVRRVLENISPCCADEDLYRFLLSSGCTVSNRPEDFDGRHGMCLFFKHRNRNQSTEPSEQIAVVGLHPPLISSAQFLRVQRILRRGAPARHGKRSERTFLAGLIRCRECGHSFGVKYTTSGGRTYAYYRCRGRESRGGCANAVYLPAEELESAVLQRCRVHLADLNFQRADGPGRAAARQAEEAEDLRGQIQNLIDGVGRGNDVVDDLLTQRITSLQERLSRLLAPPAAAPEPEEAPEPWLLRQLDRFSQLGISQKIEILRSLIRVITVDREGRVDIEYLF